MKPDIASRLRELTRPTGTEDLLDVDYPTPRFSISLRHAGVAVLVAGLGVGAWFLFQEEVEDPVTMAALAQPGTEVSTPKLEDTGIVVSVMGHVTRPGLVTLPADARVADALAAAGALSDAELSFLNLAQVLEDGVQIVVVPQDHDAGPMPGIPPAGVPVESFGLVGGGAASGGRGDMGSAGGQVSLNKATATELLTLPGVGEKTAQMILDYRESNGGFAAVDELLNIKGIGPAKFAQLSEVVTL